MFRSFSVPIHPTIKHWTGTRYFRLTQKSFTLGLFITWTLTSLTHSQGVRTVSQVSPFRPMRFSHRWWQPLIRFFLLFTTHRPSQTIDLGNVTWPFKWSLIGDILPQNNKFRWQMALHKFHSPAFKRANITDTISRGSRIWNSESVSGVNSNSEKGKQKQKQLIK